MTENYNQYNHEEIRLELAYQLKQLGFFLSAERPTNKDAGYIIEESKKFKGKKYKRAKFGFYDMGVHKNFNEPPFILIEIKTSKLKFGIRNNKRQKSKYDIAKIPWDYCEGLIDIPRIINKIQQYTNTNIPIVNQENIKLNNISIYTDGSCNNTSGDGGWSYVIVEAENEIIEKFNGKCQNATGNRMELMGAIKALEETKYSNIKIISDSKYLVDGMNRWIYKWIKNNWMRSKKNQVKNRGLWEKLIKLSENRNIKWEWVEGHSGNIFNEIADELARYDF